MFKRLLFSSIYAFLVLGIFSVHTSALSGSDFNPGLIINDAIFADNNSMTVDQIQSFLEDMLDDSDQIPDGIKGNCDNYGVESYSGTTKALYGASRGYPSPYTCLTEYFENPTTKANNLAGSVPVGAISAAQIIKNAADAYNISPKVLIVTLQKEQGLVTDDWPWSIQYRSAMGYGCPDTADCDADYYGFFNQVDSAAWQFRHYINHPEYFTYDVGNNYIPYNPNSSCSGTTINIQNQSTAALYNYTPYQPNAAALANLYGSGDACSAYGNRNFWRYFNNWFGSSVKTNGDILISTPIKSSISTPKVGETVTLSYAVKNMGAVSVDTGKLWICVSYGDKYFGLGGGQKVLSPDETLTISGDLLLNTIDTLRMIACGDLPNGTGWVYGYPYASIESDRDRTFSVTKSPLLLSQAITSSSATPKVGETVTLSYAVKNMGANSVDTGGLWMCVYYNNKAFGLGGDRKVLAPNETLTISGDLILNATGTFRVVSCGDVPNGTGWLYGYPYASSDAERDKTFTIDKSPLLISQAITSSSATPKVGETVTLSYAVKNMGANSVDTGTLWICAYSNTKAIGGGGNRKTLAAGESLIISAPYTVTETGSLKVVACGDVPSGPGWTPGYPYGAYLDHREKTYTISQSPLLISWAITSSSATPKVGETVTLSYAVKNMGANSVDTGTLWICAYSNTKAIGGGGNRKTLAAGESLIISAPYTVTETGSLKVVACGDVPSGPGWTPGYPYGAYLDHREKTYTIY